MFTVGERLRRSRERKAWTQAELASRAQVTQLTIIRIENGKTRPRLPTVRKLADALGVDPGWILFGEEDGAEERQYPEVRR